jgi:hypothetical protein
MTTLFGRKMLLITPLCSDRIDPASLKTAVLTTSDQHKVTIQELTESKYWVTTVLPTFKT